MTDSDTCCTPSEVRAGDARSHTAWHGMTWPGPSTSLAGWLAFGYTLRNNHKDDYNDNLIEAIHYKSKRCATSSKCLTSHHHHITSPHHPQFPPINAKQPNLYSPSPPSSNPQNYSVFQPNRIHLPNRQQSWPHAIGPRPSTSYDYTHAKVDDKVGNDTGKRVCKK